ncbi:defensin Ec-AMP-D1-like [Telopea speciosissima]|uniref:defensin Ec-AMP-D1-like n=1 Tax=Telopea speciosissima TaxID=54955 RepID=UPI001CC4EB61|nr:defensin Ec-AMP-D1-like [Telopea speciosissima]
MELKKIRLCSVLLVFMLLLMATEKMGPKVAEARTCESQSNHYKGSCFRHSNCGHICRSEGFEGGVCKGFRRRCFCIKAC